MFLSLCDLVVEEEEARMLLLILFVVIVEIILKSSTVTVDIDILIYQPLQHWDCSDDEEVALR